MSYCRWSSLNWQCDLYCYRGVLGYETHVASQRRTREPRPGAPDFSAILDRNDAEAVALFCKEHNDTIKDLETIPLEPIGLPADGESFIDQTLFQFRDRLTWLRAMGYRFPDHVLNMVDEEMKDGQRAQDLADLAATEQ